MDKVGFRAGMTATTAQVRFWKWFIQHEAEVFELDPGNKAEMEDLFDRLASELQKVHPKLTFELGPKGPRREFVISAAGIKDAFRAVVELAQAAPALERRQFTAFRPRRWLINVVEIGEKRIDPRDVSFSLLDNGKVAGLYIFIPRFQEGDTDLKEIGCLLLDDALGEYDVETRLGFIKIVVARESHTGRAISFTRSASQV